MVSMYIISLVIAVIFSGALYFFRDSLKEFQFSLGFILFIVCFFVPITVFLIIGQIGKIAAARNKPKLVWQLAAFIIPVLGPILISNLLLKTELGVKS